MTPDQIKLVRLSLGQILHGKAEAGKLFYQRLFAIAPDTRVLFKEDVDVQARKLMDTLAVAVSSLRDPATLMPMLQDLGRRHVAYGVHDAHYDKVGEALLWTLERMLKHDFTPQVREAWTALYGVVASTMKAVADGEMLSVRQSA